MELEISYLSEDKNGPISVKGFGSVLKLPEEYICSLFVKHGLVWFRGFSTDIRTFEKFSELFTEDFLVYPQKRDVRRAVSPSGTLKTVDLSPRFIPLHSEMAYLPEKLRPEVAWFYCKSASSKSGATTVVDGRNLANMLRASSKFSSLLINDLRYEICWDGNLWSQFTGAATLQELEEWIRVEDLSDNCHIDSNGNLILSKISPVLTRSYFGLYPVFTNNILHQNHREDRFKPIPFVDGKYISAEGCAEWREFAEYLTVEIYWQPMEFVMLDNTRYMHGRRTPGQNRKIYAKFGKLGIPNSHSSEWNDLPSLEIA